MTLDLVLRRLLIPPQLAAQSQQHPAGCHLCCEPVMRVLTVLTSTSDKSFSV